MFVCCYHFNVFSQVLNDTTISTINLRTKTGLLYKIIPAANDFPTIKEGQIVKFNYLIKLNDSLIYTSYNKVPGFQRTSQDQSESYSLAELFPMMKQGDSAIVIQSLDSMKKRGAQLPFPVKTSDVLITSIRILQIFDSDSTAKADFDMEMEKDKPRQLEESAMQMANMRKQRKEEQLREMNELQKSGEVARETKEIQSYLARKKITARRTGLGTFVRIILPGTGARADSGKYVTVKYIGKILKTDSIFQSNTYTFQLNVDPVIAGWEEGLKLFKKGGKGTLYIPGFLAYGGNPPPGSPFKPFQALVFDITIIDIKDKR